MRMPFIENDVAILSKHFAVHECIGNGILQLFKMVFGILLSDVIFCWFASTYAAFAVLLGRAIGVPSVIIVGGVDVAKDKELKYGIWLNPLKAVLVRFAIRSATKIFVVDPSLREKAMHHAKYDGYNISHLPPGLNTSFWKPSGVKERMVLTVAIVQDKQRIKIKGIDILIECARRMPTTKFHIVGLKPKLVHHLHPSENVTISDILPHYKLLPLYQRAKVYCQPSLYEAFGFALREAMLCGCIPVTTEIGGMPSAVGNVGLMVPSNDIEALVQALTQALDMPEENGLLGRARILALFPMEKRETELVRIIKKIVA